MADDIQGSGNEGQETPKATAQQDFVASAPLAEVRARLRQQRRETRAQEQSQSESNEVVASSSDTDESATDDTHESSDSQRQVESEKQRKPRKPTHVPYEEHEKALERFNSLSANMKNTADELAALKKEREDEKKQKEVIERQQEYIRTVQSIQQQVPDPTLQKQVIQAYQQSLLMGELNSFGEHVQTQQQTLAERERDLDLREVRTKLPALVDSIVTHVADRNSVPADHIANVTKEPAFQELLGMYREGRDLALIGEMLNVFASYEAKRGSSATESQRLAAIQADAENGVPTRITSAGGRNSGSTTVQNIEQVPSEKWRDFSKYMKKYGRPDAALAAMKAGKAA